jgi:hypothetical protein
MVAEAKPFSPVKLICGVIFSSQNALVLTEERLTHLYGPIDFSSTSFAFDLTDYYEKQMGKNLRRKFLSFERLIDPENLSEIKLGTNRLEKEIQLSLKTSLRAVNIDPGYLTSSALIMATAKNFAHRVPLKKGIYAHLELLLTRKEARSLDWTYPDFKRAEYQDFFLRIRRIYLSQLAG